MFLRTKQLYQYNIDSYGANDHWNYNELKAPIVTMWRVEGQNWPVGYRKSRTVWIHSHFCDCAKLIFSLLQKLSDFSVGILKVYLRKMFIMWCFTKIIINFCEEFENTPYQTNIAEKCQEWRLYSMWRHISPNKYSGYCYTVHCLIEK